MSVWESVETLKDFVYKSFHVNILKRKNEWFNKFDNMHQVLWWLPAGAIPDIEEGKARLGYLQEYGESATAFSFRKSFPPSEQHLHLPTSWV